MGVGSRYRIRICVFQRTTPVYAKTVVVFRLK